MNTVLRGVPSSARAMSAISPRRDATVTTSPGFAPNNHNGSSFVELTVIGRDLKFGY